MAGIEKPAVNQTKTNQLPRWSRPSNQDD